jgi:exopolyphosphatase/guanosine-5'-triphosphate,3'-diphosphate pyrophosphatase
LRIADGLDRSHTDNVTEIACDLYEEGVRLRLVTRTSARDELYGLQKKSGLFEEVFGLTVWPQLVPNLSDCK